MRAIAAVARESEPAVVNDQSDENLQCHLPLRHDARRLFQAFASSVTAV